MWKQDHQSSLGSSTSGPSQLHCDSPPTFTLIYKQILCIIVKFTFANSCYPARRYSRPAFQVRPSSAFYPVALKPTKIIHPVRPLRYTYPLQTFKYDHLFRKANNFT